MAGPSPVHTPARWPTKHSRASSSPPSSRTLWPTTRSRRATTSGPLAASRKAAVASATTTSGRDCSRARFRRLAADTAAVMRSAGIEPVAPTAMPRLSSALRRITGASPLQPTWSHTRTWNELLPRSQTAARTTNRP